MGRASAPATPCPATVIPEGEPPPFLPILVLAPEGARRDAILEGLSGTEPRVLGGWDAGVPGEQAGGVVVLDSTLPPETVVRVLRDLGAASGEWGLVLVDGAAESGALRALPLSPGVAGPLPEVALLEARGFNLRTLLREVGRARHDLNNPLTSALAEVQLLLMDHPEEAGGELRESLVIVQAQLRRLRDRVGDLGRFRSPGR